MRKMMIKISGPNNFAKKSQDGLKKAMLESCCIKTTTLCNVGKIILTLTSITNSLVAALDWQVVQAILIKRQPVFLKQSSAFPALAPQVF